MTNSLIPKYLKRVSKTDLTSSSMEEPVEETHSAPALSRKEYSDDYSHASKFIEAMKNPNWRQRSEDSEACGPPSADLASHEIKLPEKRKKKKKPIEASNSGSSADGHGFNRPPNFWDYIAADAAAAHWKSRRGIYNAQKEHSQVHSSEASVGCSEYPGQQTDFCVLRHVGLRGVESQGKPISVFELAPITAEGSLHSNVDHSGSPPRVRVQQLDKGNPPSLQVFRAPGQLGMPVPLPAGVTLKAFPAELIPPSSSRVERARKAVIEDPAVARIGDCRRLVVSRDALGDGTNISTELSVKGHSGTSQRDRDVRKKREEDGFQKLLHKLKRKPERAIDQQKVQNHGDDAQCETGFWNSEGQWEHHRRNVLKQESTDSGLGSLDESIGAHYKDGSKDSGVFVDGKDPSLSLNPRAREFLSLTGTGFTATKQAVDPTVAPQAMSEGFCSKGSDTSVCFTPSASPEKLDALCEPFPFIDSNKFPALAGNLLPTFLGSLPLAGPLATAGLALLPQAGSQPLSGLQFPHLTPLGPSVPLGPNQLPPLSYTPPAFTDPAASVPPQRFIPSPTAAPFTPLGATGAIDVRVKPVPKPKVPDTASQQNYEAWLEFRKATEPGYALACKQRQQFRAQRKLQNLPGPAAKSGALTEVKAG